MISKILIEVKISIKRMVVNNLSYLIKKMKKIRDFVDIRIK